jgi:hypothetical protein
MFYRRFIVFFVMAALAGCGGSSAIVPSSSPAYSASSLAAPDASGNEIPKSYRCLPSGLPGGPFQPGLAYISQCAVAQAPEADNLQKLAIALMFGDGTRFAAYCTGTPISYNASTNVGFVVTAAHCVVGGEKAPATNVAPKNITTFDIVSGLSKNSLYQGTRAILGSRQLINGKITAVYLPSRYCRMPQFLKGGCSNPQQANGDIAVLRVQGVEKNTIRTLKGLRLGGPHLTLKKDQLIMALGYGVNTSHEPNSRELYYVDYQFFAKDSFQNFNSAASLMNGYHKNNLFYSIICSGDSGGGDFAWNGKEWALIGAHSFGTEGCGMYNQKYANALDVSADLRPWQSFIQTVVDKAKQPGCANLGPEYVCRSGK